MDDNDKTTRDKLADQIGTAPWSLLEVHAQNDHLILVDSSLTILDVALGIAENHTDVVSTWITDGLVGKPTLEQWDAFKSDHVRRFQFVVVQPYVLAQLVNVDF